MIKVAVYDTKSYDQHEFAKVAAELSITCEFHEFRLSATTAASAHTADAVCVFVNDQVDRDCLAALKEAGIRHLALRCAGFNNVDSVAAAEMGIVVTRVPAYSPHAVAEHSVALLLSLNRKIHRAHSRVRELNFSLHGLVGFDLFGKTIGIIGTGKIGRLTAQIFRGFGTQVIASDPYPATDWAKAHDVHYLPVEELLAQSHVISLHLPLTPESYHLLNRETLQKIKPGAYIVNTSRGKLIDTTALIEGLKTGRVGGVALDVYEEEEGVFFEDLSDGILADDELGRLLTFPNVLITAHQAFLTQEALAEIARVTLTNVARLAGGEAPLEGTAVS